MNSNTSESDDFVDLDAEVAALDARPDLKETMVAARKAAGSLLYGSDLPGLKALRLHAGLSQKEFAKRMESTQATVSKWEAGTVDCRASTIDKMSNVLGVERGLVCEVICRSFKNKGLAGNG
ncbi:helix-turn-helix domain-containing protein [Pseudoxanthomonas mexicana]|uniref:helix-turn-helix domain-containing protein n=1 Tax=Pseudoxanthomonas mexicana TaxID=128785 RepID=UPI0028A9A8BE|nr:helix-turn-helix domain-containing protein [Pseudoxanthomonas mexicana]